MENPWKDLMKATVELGEAVLDVLSGAEATPKPKPANSRPSPPSQRERTRVVPAAALEDLSRSVERQKKRLEEALKRYHGNGLLPTRPLPLDQVVDAAVNTIDKAPRDPKTFPAHVVPDEKRIIESLRLQVADLEAQQAADVKALASQARELDTQRQANRTLYNTSVFVSKLRGQSRKDPESKHVYYLKSVYRHGKVWNVVVFCPEPESRLTLSLPKWMNWAEDHS